MKYLPINQILVGDALANLKTLPEKSINCCITSPPYYGLRDYGMPEQLGLEKTPEQYIEKLVFLFREVHRVLKDDGSLWLNIGDSYWGGKGMSGSDSPSKTEMRNNNNLTKNKSYHQIGGKNEIRPTDRKHSVIKPKDLIGIPWMLAFALRADGWYLRQDIIWHKPNVMPESVRDRCTKSHEYIFLLSKSRKYYFDNESIKEPCVSRDANLRNRDISKLNNTPGRTKMKGLVHNDYEMRNKRDVWTIPPASFKKAHFAVFPEKLIIDCVKAGCPIGGVVLDPFFGSGTTGIVSHKLSRSFIGIELNPEYITIAKERLSTCNIESLKI